MHKGFKAKVRARVRRQVIPPAQNNRRRSSVENVVTNIMRIEDFRNQKNNALKFKDPSNVTSTSRAKLSRRKGIQSTASETSEPENTPER